MHEKGKILVGQRNNEKQEFFSFWQPYIESASECYSAIDWEKEDYHDLGLSFKEEILFYQIQMAQLKIKMIDCLENRP